MSLAREILHVERRGSHVLAFIRGIVGYGRARDKKMIYVVRLELEGFVRKKVADAKVIGGAYKLATSSGLSSYRIIDDPRYLAHPQVSEGGRICPGSMSFEGKSLEQALLIITDVLNASNPSSPFRSLRPLPNEDYVVSMGREEFFRKLLNLLKRRLTRG